MTQYCPHCGGRLADDLDGRPGLRLIPDDGGRVARYGLGDVAEGGPAWHEFRRPARPADVTADVIAPALQAVVTGVAAAAVSAVAALSLNLSLWAVPTAAGLAFAGAWLYLLRDGRAALWEVERYEHGPAEPPAPAEPPRPTTRLSVSLEGGRTQQERDLPVEPDQLIRLARALAGGAHTFSERDLSAAGLVTGRRQFEELRDQFLAAGWLRWKSAADRRQGLELTTPGRAALAALADGRATVEDMAAPAGVRA